MKRKNIIIFSAVAVLVIIGFAAFGISRANAELKASGVPKNAPMVQTEEAKLDTIITKVNASGKVELIENTTVYASTSAKVKEINLKAGDEVTAGQVLLSYDTETLETLNRNLADAELSVRTAEINLRNAKALPTETEIFQSEAQVRSAEKSIADIGAQIEQADINYEQLQRSLETAQDNYRRVKVLYDGGIKPRSELDSAQDSVSKLEDQIRTAESQKTTLLNSRASAETSLELAQKQYDSLIDRANDPKYKNAIDLQEIALEQARRQVEKIKNDIGDFVENEVASVSGTVLSTSATEGQTISKGSPIAVIADTSLGNMIITDYIPENDTKNLALDQEVEISGGALGNEVYKGHVSKISPIAEMRQIGNSQEAALTVEITADSPDIPIKAGYTVDTDIITKISADVVVVPLMSVQSESGGINYVYIVNGENVVERRDVKLLTYSNLYVEVDSVSVGERVILNPTSNIKEGIVVRASEY